MTSDARPTVAAEIAAPSPVDADGYDVARAVEAAAEVFARQPYRYRYEPSDEPDWTRLPGYVSVTDTEWHDPVWQRRNTVRSVAELAAVLGRFLDPRLAESIQRDQEQCATMPLSVPPQMINTMDETWLESDPLRRYMLPAFSDRDAEWPTHPAAHRDSLHEAEMFAVEGLIHRYPTKVLIEMTFTCPQYCGHCTRMDVVGQDVGQVEKLRLRRNRKERHDAALEYLRRVPWVRDVVVSGGDIANVPIVYLERFLASLFEIENIRSVRLATKALIGIPQYFLDSAVLAAFERIASNAEKHDVSLALHVHVNHVRSVTPSVVAATRALRNVGVQHVRNQGVILRGVNDSLEDLLDVSFALLDQAQITPYYFYMCDMIPYSEHWRVSLARAQELQRELMGYLPGFATPRVVCDVPHAGKRLVHEVAEYDRVTGVSSWSKHFLTRVDLPPQSEQLEAKRYHYFDPVPTLPPEGQEYWRTFAAASTRRNGGAP
ncbi:MAG: KamA family radical SAM protein [Gaiellaceae bacterium]